QKFEPRTILFDKDRGSEIFLRALGGRYEKLSRGAPTGFNPPLLPDTPGNRAFLRDWLGCLLEPEGPDEEMTIATAVDDIFSHNPDLRRLRFLRDLLGGGRRPRAGDLPSRLGPWILGGEHSSLFDNSEGRLHSGKKRPGFTTT